MVETIEGLCGTLAETEKLERALNGRGYVLQLEVRKLNSGLPNKHLVAALIIPESNQIFQVESNPERLIPDLLVAFETQPG